MRNRLIPSARDTAVFARSTALLDDCTQFRVVAQVGDGRPGRLSLPLLPAGKGRIVQGDQRGDVGPPVANHDALGDEPVLAHPVAHAAGTDSLLRTEAAKHRHAVTQVVTWTFLVLVYCLTAVLVVQRFGVPLTGLVAPARSPADRLPPARCSRRRRQDRRQRGSGQPHRRVTRQRRRRRAERRRAPSRAGPRGAALRPTPSPSASAGT